MPDNFIDRDIFYLLLTLAIALGTFFTAIGASVSARETKRIADDAKLSLQAQLVTKFLDDYSSQEMLDHLHRVREFYKKVIDCLSPELARFEYEDEVKQVDQSRRYVKHYFFKAQLLKNAGYVDEEFMKQICGRAGFRLLFSTIEPLEEREGMIEENDQDIYNQLRIYYIPRENPITELLRRLKEASA